MYLKKKQTDGFLNNFDMLCNNLYLNCMQGFMNFCGAVFLIYLENHSEHSAKKTLIWRQVLRPIIKVFTWSKENRPSYQWEMLVSFAFIYTQESCKKLINFTTSISQYKRSIDYTLPEFADAMTCSNDVPFWRPES